MATARMPAREPGSRPANAKRSGPLELVDVPRKPPAPPKGLDTRSRAIWRALFAEPIAELWREVDRDLVLRLILLRRRLELELADAPGWVYGVVQGIEDRLLLNPRARRAAGIVYVEPVEATKESAGVRRLDERRRARIAHG